MKKLFLGLFALVCLFTLVACEQPQPPVGGTDEPPVEEGIEKYKEELNAYINELIPNDVDASVELPEYYEYEDGALATFAWKSSNGITLSSKGKYRQNLFDEVIELTSEVVFADPYGEETVFTVSKKVNTKGTESVDEYKSIIESYLPEYVYKDFELVEKDGTYRGKNAFGYITYTSTNPEVITSDGKYVNQLVEDQVVEFCYKVEINGIVIEGSKKITVEGKKFDYYTQEAAEYLDEYFKGKEVIYDELELPKTDDNGRVEIVWTSSDLLVLSHDGELQTFDPGKEVTMSAEIKCYDGTLVWEKKFRTYNEDELLDFIVERMHRDIIQQYVMGVYAYAKDNYGYIPFYVQDAALSDMVYKTTKNNESLIYLEGSNNTNVKKMDITSGILPWDATGRTLIKQEETAFITIHDTGDAVNSAAWWNAYESSGRDTRQTSWHFTVGDTEIYQHAPLEEVAWHAGDGSARFGLNDTGVKYEGPNPVITIGEDHYLYINGQKSKIGVPIIGGSSKSEWNGRFANEISPAGIYTCLGENGNYYMASVHASNYWQNSLKFQVCTNGGNRNSIGIETCINSGVDYNQVMRNTANLVANLLTYFGLEPDRVLYHRHFSGKLCPQVMIENNLLDNFHNMIENEYIIKKYLSGVSFTYESNNPELLDKNGRVLKEVNVDTKVSYKVTVSYNGVTKTFEKETIIKPIK